MFRNSFMTRAELLEIGFRHLGSGVEISSNAKFYRPDLISIGDHVRIDDFSVISVGEESYIEDWVHIGVNVFITAQKGVRIGKFSGLSSGVRVFGSSDNFSESYAMHPKIPSEFRRVENIQIVLECFNQVGANSVLLPGAHMRVGSVLGSISLLKQESPEWQILAGVPARIIGHRNHDKDVLSKLEAHIKNSYR
jgi:acetyltransferase-like isoleucine patch superfamily enzyme